MITGKTAKIVSKMGVGTVLECQSRFKSARVPKDVSKDVSRREGVNVLGTAQVFLDVCDFSES